MTELAQHDPWSGARSSMQRFERTAMTVSGIGIAGTAWLAVAVILLGALGVLLNLNTARIRESFAWTHHADEIMLQIASIQQGIAAAEAGTRAFALTGDAANITALHRAGASLAASRKALAALVSDNPGQARKLNELGALIDERLARFDWFVGLDRGAMRLAITTVTPAALAMRARQRKITADVANGLTAFRAREAALLRDRRAAAEHDTAILNYLVLALALFAPVCGFAGFYLLSRERHRQSARVLQVELIHTQRLALMGETASMLVHEVNQPLAAATNYLSVLNRMAGAANTPPEKLKDAVQRSADQVARAVSIVQRLRNFIAKRDSERQMESPALLVTDAVALYETLGSSVRLKTHVASDLPNLLVDPVQIQQVLMNLMRNALEAMVESERRELDLDVGAGTRGTVAFRLRDSGPGLPKDIADQLFRPFVSTKAEGMGVGLSICQKIVTDHAGRIWAEPADGGGTVFCFTLPALDDADAEAA